MKRILFQFVLLATILFCVQSVTAQNLVADGGFESGGAWNVYGEAAREPWANRQGNYGVALYGWVSTGYGGIWQDVPSGGIGTYTFAIFIRFEQDFVTPPTTFELKLEGYGLDGSTKTEVDTIADWRSIPKDGLWHHVFVTKTYTNPGTVYIRPVVYAAWLGGGSGAQSVMMDDASVYVGVYTGAPSLANTSFEDWNGTNQWRGTCWATYDEGEMAIEPWANRSGARGVALPGWEPESLFRTTRVGQAMTKVPTGSHTFSVWVLREPDFVLSNMALRLEFYDITLTNKVQADVVTNFVVPNDNFWRNYYVVGAVTNSAVHEVRTIIQKIWKRSAVGSWRALKIDDVRFFPAAHDGWGVLRDWAYHGAVGGDPRLESVPGTNVGPFLRINYNTRTNTFFVLANSPDLAKYTHLGDKGYVGVRTAYQRPENGSWQEVYKLGNRVGSVVIPAGGFRGLPISGAVTVDLWKVELPHPTDTNGNFYVTNSIRVYYVPYLTASNAGVWTETKFLVARAGVFTNGWGQTFHNEFWAKDYEVDIAPPIVNDAFTNGGFENPVPPTNNLNNTGWIGTGGASRDGWAARSGASGAYFPSWDPGSASLYQDALTAGGATEFSFWMRVLNGAQPTSLEAVIEWYNSDGALVQVNRQDLMPLVSKGDFWTKVGVIGNCDAPGLHRARYIIRGSYGDGTEPYNEALYFDDADVREARTAVVNPSFEEGPQWFPDGWFVQPGQYAIGGREPWAHRSGAYGFALYGWDTNHFQGRLMQPISLPGTGTYVFSIWMSREANANLSNAALRLEWFSSKDSSKVQADTVKLLSVPNDGAWYQYSITGTCSVTDSLYVQASLEFAFGPGSTSLTLQAVKIDDADFYRTNVVSESTDGIPNWWLQQFGLGLTNGVGAGDDDGDGFSNAEEYAADTNPTNFVAKFTGVRRAAVSGGWGLISTEHSTNSRYYFLEYKTNLLDATPWLPYGGAILGNAEGTPVIFATTNDTPQRFYRIGVKP